MEEGRRERDKGKMERLQSTKEESDPSIYE